MGKMVLTNDQYSFMPVQNGDTILLDYQCGGKVYTEYAVYNATETGLFQLTPSEIVEQNTKIVFIESKQKVMFYPNPNNGEFVVSVDGLKDAATS
jgi:L-cysteine desulfidase